MRIDTSPAALVAAMAARQAEIGQALSGLDREELRRESRLPGWDRLTIVCHLRYGATASHRMTEDSLGGLPMRLQRLPTRRSNHRSADRSLDGSWALISVDGPSFLIRAQGDTVEVHESTTDPLADTAIVGTGRQLLAFILGRAPLNSLQIRGDQNLAASFLTAFPGP